uniref:RecD helicase /ATP-dependent exoDNAse n=1 Tax=Pithovirus LCDPAC02 TaxID=2506601 RepID=A0A481YNZ3_9VIRU|nr:MAG: RecD helicase /ATP-dependent exoDNAse [Pithovirus LCDPAC02]
MKMSIIEVNENHFVFNDDNNLIKIKYNTENIKIGDYVVGNNKNFIIIVGYQYEDCLYFIENYNLNAKKYLYELINNYGDKYSLKITKHCKLFYRFGYIQSSIFMEKRLGIKGYRKKKSFCYEWLLNFEGRQIKLLNQDYYQFIYEYYCFPKKIRCIDEKDFYKQYWIKIDTMKNLFKIFNKNIDKNEFKFYLLSRDVYWELIGSYVPYKEINTHYFDNILSLLNTKNIKKILIKYGNRFSKNNKYIANETIVHEIQKIKNSFGNINNCVNFNNEYDLINHIKNFQDINDIEFGDKQKEAILSVFDNNKIITIDGMPGTGKTTIIFCILYLLEILNKLLHKSLHIEILTFMGKASGRLNSGLNKLKTKINLRSKTCHMFFCKDYKKELLETTNYIDFIIFDEASTISHEIFLNVIKNLKFGKLIMIGDNNQLPPVKGISIFPSMISYSKYIKLEIIYRNQFKDVNLTILDKKTISSISKYKDLVNIEEYENLDILCNFYLESIISNEFSKNVLNEIEDKNPYFEYKYNFISSKIICHTNDTKDLINQKIRKLCNYDEEYSDGEVMIILNNDYKLDIFNGDEFIIVNKNLEIKKFLCYFYQTKRFIYLTLKYLQNNCDYAYCITIHKSQGSEWKKILFYIDSLFKFKLNLAYTAITRAKIFCWIYVKYDSFLRKKMKPEIEYNKLFEFDT